MKRNTPLKRGTKSLRRSGFKQKGTKYSSLSKTSSQGTVRPHKRSSSRIALANTVSRQIIASICEAKQLNRCELQLPGCMHTWPLAPAHRHKRAWYKGSVELLADYNQWVVACQVCHDRIEHNKELTEAMFLKLRQ